MKRFKKRRSWWINKKKFLLFVTVITMFFCCFLFYYINDRLVSKLAIYAETEMQRLGRLLANKVVVEQIDEDISEEDLFIINKNNDLIQTIDFNTTIVNRFLGVMTSNIETYFRALESGNYELLDLESNNLIDYDSTEGIVFKIPSGLLFDNVFLNNLGPKIPVKFTLTGDIGSRIETKITNYGINNALVETSAEITINMRMLLPFTTKYITIPISIPIIIKLINGTVPSYYFNGLSESSNIFALPIN